MSELSVGQLRGLTVNSNVISVPSGHTLYAPGHVVQVVQGVKTDTLATSTVNTWLATGITATITPKFSSSKILVTTHIQIGGNGGTSFDAGFGLFRNNSQIALPSSYGSRLPIIAPWGQRADSLYEMSTVSGEFLDSPNSTSALTYDIRGYIAANAYAHYINRTGSDSDAIGDTRGISVITLMEIAQ
jgi:hypothetical protein